jgi:FtsP/CotA-like multicopper oxidase with cupredoxin domain
MGMMGRRMHGMMGRWRTDEMPLLEPDYNAYTVNGKVNKAGDPFMVRKGDKIRFRIMNPASATVFTLRLAGHSLLVTHADGRPVEPMEVDVLRIGMGERYDVSGPLGVTYIERWDTCGWVSADNSALRRH